MSRLLRVIRDFVRHDPLVAGAIVVIGYVAFVLLGHWMGPFVIAHRDMVDQTGPDIVSDGSCFDGQRVPQAERPALDAVVFLLVRHADGKVTEAGTGTIIRDSRDAAGHNRILTVRHLLQKAGGANSHVRVYDRFGNLLAVAVQDPATFLSPVRLSQEPESVVRGVRGDGAVLLDMVKAGRAYDAIDGLEIAPELYRGIMTGWFSDPAALMAGSSGSALLNSSNQVIGIMEAVNQATATFRTELTVHEIMAFIELHHRHADAGHAYSFQHGGYSYFVPVPAPGVLETLQLNPAVAPPDQTYDVHVFGYPQDACVAYHGKAYSRTFQPPLDALARRWHILSGL